MDNALDSGIRELDFWEMTPAEVRRAIESRNRQVKIETQERATFDYLLANLIVKGFSITMGGKGSYPTIQEAYPTIFDDINQKQEEKIQEKKEELSAIRFRQFAESFNDRFKKEVSKESK